MPNYPLQCVAQKLPQPAWGAVSCGWNYDAYRTPRADLFAQQREAKGVTVPGSVNQASEAYEQSGGDARLRSAAQVLVTGADRGSRS
jgi:hypothetical protein